MLNVVSDKRKNERMNGMLKIFLTGDNHIGSKYANYGEKATYLAEKRIDAFENMVSIANEEQCSIFAIAGDLFDNINRIKKSDVKSLLEKLSKFHDTVVILPGNHDYYNENARVWKYFSEMVHEYDNIILLTEYKPYTIPWMEESVTLYPAFCTSSHSGKNENNLDWIKKIEIHSEKGYHIGIAHGAVEGETIDTEGMYFLMQRSELESIPVDVWLLGHTHVPFPKNLTENMEKADTRIFNAGTHVQTNVSCNTDGRCFIIQIDDEKKVQTKSVHTGNLYFYRKSVEVTPGNLEKALDHALADISDQSIVELRLAGALSMEEFADKHQIIQNAMARFIEGKYQDENLVKEISQDLIDSEFAETAFSSIFLKALLQEPKEAQMVYDMLMSMKEGK